MRNNSPSNLTPPVPKVSIKGLKNQLASKDQSLYDCNYANINPNINDNIIGKNNYEIQQGYNYRYCQPSHIQSQSSVTCQECTDLYDKNKDHNGNSRSNYNLNDYRNQSKSIENNQVYNTKSKQKRRRKIFQRKVIKATVIQPQHPTLTNPHQNTHTLQPTHTYNTKKQQLYNKIRTHDIDVQDSYEQYYTLKNISQKSSQNRSNNVNNGNGNKLLSVNSSGSSYRTVVQPKQRYGQVSRQKSGNKYQMTPIIQNQRQEHTQSRNSRYNINPSSPYKNTHHHQHPSPIKKPLNPPTQHPQQNSPPTQNPTIKWNYFSHQGPQPLNHPQVHITHIPHTAHISHINTQDAHLYNNNVDIFPVVNQHPDGGSRFNNTGTGELFRINTNQFDYVREKDKKFSIDRLPSFAKNNEQHYQPTFTQQHEQQQIPKNKLLNLLNILPKQLNQIRSQLQTHQSHLTTLTQKLHTSQTKNTLRQKQLLQALIKKQKQLTNKQQQLNDNLQNMGKMYHENSYRCEKVLKYELELQRAKRIEQLAKENQKLTMELSKSNQMSRQTNDLTPFDHPINTSPSYGFYTYTNSLTNQNNYLSNKNDKNIHHQQNPTNPYLSLNISRDKKPIKYDQNYNMNANMNIRQISAVSPYLYQYQQYHQSQSEHDHDNTLRELLSPLEIRPDFQF